MNTNDILYHLEKGDQHSVFEHFQPLVTRQANRYAEPETDLWKDLMAAGNTELFLILDFERDGDRFHEKVKNPDAWLTAAIKRAFKQHMFGGPILSGDRKRRERVRRAQEMSFNYTEDEIARKLKKTPKTIRKYLGESSSSFLSDKEQLQVDGRLSVPKQHEWIAVLEHFEVLQRVTSSDLEEDVLTAAWDNSNSLDYGPRAWGEMSYELGISTYQIEKILTCLLNRYYLLVHECPPRWTPRSGSRSKMKVA